MANADEKLLGITCIHTCRDGVYVERGKDNWFLAVPEDQMHCFAEIGNWTDATWELHRRDPPCHTKARELSEDFARRHR